MRFKRVSNLFLNNYLQDNGFYPIYEEYDDCYYERSKDLKAALERFYITYTLIPNKL